MYSAWFRLYDFSPLTVNQLVKTVSTVTDWHNLGLQLGLTMSQLKEIEQNLSYQIQGLSRLRAEILNVWLRNSPNATWGDLITALRAIGENRVASDIEAVADYSPTTSKKKLLFLL